MPNSDTGDDLAARLADLEDLEAIRALKVRYARYADDSYNPDGLASLFAEGAVWDGGALFGRVEGVEAIREHFRGAPGRIPWALHFTLSPEITLEGSPGPDRRASGSWYLWQPCTRRSSNGTEWQAWLTGTYADTYVKVGGTWKFETVAVDARWLSGPPPAEAPNPPGS